VIVVADAAVVISIAADGVDVASFSPQRRRVVVSAGRVVSFGVQFMQRACGTVAVL